MRKKTMEASILTRVVASLAFTPSTLAHSTIARTAIVGLAIVGLATSPAIPGDRTSLASKNGTASQGAAGEARDVLLTVTISGHGEESGETYRLDRATLQSIGSTFLQTSTPWTDGVPVFRGVLARDLLQRLGTVPGPLEDADGGTVRAIALNDYRYDIPLADFLNYPVLLAYEMNGEALEVRGKGPIWIVYPLDHYGELRTRITERKMVWQLVELQIR